MSNKKKQKKQIQKRLKQRRKEYESDKSTSSSSSQYTHRASYEILSLQAKVEAARPIPTILPQEFHQLYLNLKAYQAKLEIEAKKTLGKTNVTTKSYCLTIRKAQILTCLLNIISHKFKNTRVYDAQDVLNRLRLLTNGRDPITTYAGDKYDKLLTHRYWRGTILYYLSFGLFKPKSARLVNAALETFESYLTKK